MIEIEEIIEEIFNEFNFKIIDATTNITNRTFLNKIWKAISSVSLAQKTKLNIYYELEVV